MQWTLPLILFVVASSLSTLGSFVVIVTLLVSRSYTNSITETYYRMILWLSITNSFTTMTGIVLAPYMAYNNPLCFFQAMTGHICDLSVSFWYTLLPIELYCILSYSTQNTESFLRQRWFLYCILNWSLAVLIPFLALIVLRGKLYDSEDTVAWCFISPDYPLAMFVSYYLPQILGWAVCVYYSAKSFHYTKVMSTATRSVSSVNIVKPRHEYEDGVEQESITAAQRRLLLYPLTFVLLFSTALVDRSFQWIMGYNNEVLSLLHSTCFPAEGFITGMLFLTSHGRMKKLWKDNFTQCFLALGWTCCFPRQWCSRCCGCLVDTSMIRQREDSGTNSTALIPAPSGSSPYGTGTRHWDPTDSQRSHSHPAYVQRDYTEEDESKLVVPLNIPDDQAPYLLSAESFNVT